MACDPYDSGAERRYTQRLVAAGRPASGRQAREGSSKLAILEFIEGPQAGKVVTLGAQTHLGRLSGVPAESSSVISFSDERVSRQHARIVRRGGNFFIEDLNSTNGTVLKNVQLRPWIPYPLQDGDEIGICTTRLRFREIPETSNADATAAGG